MRIDSPISFSSVDRSARPGTAVTPLRDILREQEQRRHEGQVQQIQMELRQAQQSALVRQDEITQLHRDNERLLTENRGTLRELSLLQDQLKQTNARQDQLLEQVNRIDSERQQPKQYGNGAQGQKGNDESRKCQVPGGTQR